jgi:hypothetical protein
MTDEDSPIRMDLKADTKDVVNLTRLLSQKLASALSCVWPIIEAKADVRAALTRAKGVDKLTKTYQMTKEEAEALVLRSDQREQLQQIRYHQNIEAIVLGALLVHTESVNDQPVDEDWISEFLEQCKNVSSDQMRSVWSKILAAEVAHPGSFTKRTLSFVRQLSQSEASLFTNFCSFVWQDSDSMFVILGADGEIPEDLGYEDLVELEALGLIKYDPNGGLYRTDQITYFGQSYKVETRYGSDGMLELPSIPLTSLGKSLATIAGAKKNENYMLTTIKFLQTNFSVTFEMISQKSKCLE